MLHAVRADRNCAPDIGGGESTDRPGCSRGAARVPDRDPRVRQEGVPRTRRARVRRSSRVSTTPPPDVPSPVDLRTTSDARAWEASAAQRPGRDEMLDRITEEAARLTAPGDRILELGSDPGFLARRILERLPGVQYTALDFSPAMHELARARLQEWSQRVRFLERSFRSAGWSDELGPFELVVTNQAVHELRHKRYAPELHRQVLGVLARGGSYLVSDHFSDPGGKDDTELYMTRAEQQRALQDAGFASVERLAVAGTLVLHRARRA